MMVKSTQSSREGSRYGSLANSSSLSSACSSARRRRHCAPAVTIALFLIATASVCKSAPVKLDGQEVQPDLQILRETGYICSSILFPDQPLQASDSLEELCYLIMWRMKKSQGLKAREESKRGKLQGPGGIQSRGYFLYRPRNGRNSAAFVKRMFAN